MITLLLLVTIKIQAQENVFTVYFLNESNVEYVCINDNRYEIHLNHKGKDEVNKINFDSISCVMLETSNEKIYLLPYNMSLRPDDLISYRTETGSIFNSKYVFIFYANHLKDKKRLEKFKKEFKKLKSNSID